MKFQNILKLGLLNLIDYGSPKVQRRCSWGRV